MIEPQVPAYLAVTANPTPAADAASAARSTAVAGVSGQAAAAAPVVQLPGTTRAKRTRGPGIDHERMEIDYRAATKTVREIGAEHGVSGARVSQLAKKLGWTQDMRAKARIQAAAILAKPVAPSGPPVPADTAPHVEVMAVQMAMVRRSHRGAIERMRDHVAVLMKKLEGVRKMDLPARAGVLRTLIESTRVLVALERQAYDLDVPGNNEPPPVPKDGSMTPREAYTWLAQQRPAV